MATFKGIMDVPEEVITWRLKNLKTKRKPVINAWYTAKQNNETSYERTMRPLHKLMKIIGVIPIVQDQHGVRPAKLISPLVFYTVILYTIQVVNSVLAVIRRLHHPRVTWTTKCGYMIFNLQYAAIPVTFWISLPKICSHLTRLQRFHTNFQRATGHDLDYGLEKVVRYVTIILVIASITLSWVWVYGDIPDELWSIFVYPLPLLLNFTYDTSFCVTCVMMGLAATKIISELKERLRGLEFKGERTVQDHHSLWLELSNVLCSHNQVTAVTFSYHVTHLFLLLTISLYKFLDGLNYQWSTLQGALFASVSMCVIELWVIAIAAQYVSDKFESCLFDHFLLIPDTKFTKCVNDELSALLNTTGTCPRVIDIGGFLTINKSWLVNMLGGLLSSLIILVQFQIANDDCSEPNGLPTNGTQI